MEVTRILSLVQFDGNRGRFSNVVFKHVKGESSDTPDRKLGISVFENDCPNPRLEGDRICQHIAQFYDPPFPQPCAFWIFDTIILRPAHEEDAPEPRILNVRSESGDDCHRNIHCLTNSRAQRIFDNRVGEGSLGLCYDGLCEVFSETRAVELKTIAWSKLGIG